MIPRGRSREKGFNPSLSCLETIVALSQTYQLSYQLDLIRTVHTFHTVHTHIDEEKPTLIPVWFYEPPNHDTDER